MRLGLVLLLLLSPWVAALDGAASLEPVFARGKLLRPDLAGVWDLPGYGNRLHLEAREARLVAVTEAGCWDISPVLEGADLYMAQVGDRTLLAFDPAETPLLVERLADPPEACREPERWSPAAIFEVFAALMSELYPFFEERGFDWPARLVKVRARVGDDMTEDQLFEAMTGALDGLDDGHMGLSARIDGVRHELGGTTPLAIRRLSDLLDQVGETEAGTPERSAQLQALTGSLFDGVREKIRERLLHGDARLAARQYTWGRLDEDIGYIAIMGMTGDESMDLEAQLGVVHEAFDEMLAGLAGVRALVVDVSMNGGGRDAFSQAMAAHFADARRLAYTKGPGGRPDVRHEVVIEPWPGRRFTGPVYVVSSDLTASAAEIFQLCMRAQPHVRLAGAPGAAIFSDVIPKPLPNGWDLGMSIEVYRDAEGICHEAVGVPLDLPLPVFEGPDIRTSHAEAIEALAAHIREGLGED